MLVRKQGAPGGSSLSLASTPNPYRIPVLLQPHRVTLHLRAASHRTHRTCWASGEKGAGGGPGPAERECYDKLLGSLKQRRLRGANSGAKQQSAPPPRARVPPGGGSAEPPEQRGLEALIQEPMPLQGIRGDLAVVSVVSSTREHE